MATSRTFEVLWGKLENEKTAFESLESKVSENKIPKNEKSKRLAIIKKNLEEITARAQERLRDPWEEEMMVKSVDELLAEVTKLF